MNIFDIFNNNFASRWSGGCSGWDEQLATAHVIADIAIWFAYMTIPVMLVWLCKKRKDIPFDFVFWLFAMFIIGCGFTHLVGAITVFYPFYVFDFWIKAITAVLSLGTAGVLFRILPRMISMPNPYKSQGALEKVNADLENVNAELKQFAYVASHDLKAPLRAISNLATWVSDDLKESGHANETIDKHVTLMHSRIKRMENLIDGILQYSRVGRINIESKFVDSGVVVAEAIASMPPSKFIFEIQPNLPTITANEVMIGQVFGNLIGNSVKHHNRNDGRVEIGWKDDGKFYQFWVKDDGPGIDPKHFSRLFVPFQTLQPRDIKESTGIGLALCKKIVENQGGKIWVESEVGMGANFIFTWPK